MLHVSVRFGLYSIVPMSTKPFNPLNLDPVTVIMCLPYTQAQPKSHAWLGLFDGAQFFSKTVLKCHNTHHTNDLQ